MPTCEEQCAQRYYDATAAEWARYTAEYNACGGDGPCQQAATNKHVLIQQAIDRAYQDCLWECTYH